MCKAFALLAVVLALGCVRGNKVPAKGMTEPLERLDLGADEGLPLGKLPQSATPTAYALNLVIDPAADTFSGDVAIKVLLNKPHELIWMHGRGLRVKTAQVTLFDGKVISATWQQMTPDGLARLSFGQNLPPQEITIVIGYEASFSHRVEGLYKVVSDGKPYVFAQLEAISGRLVFPGFDEPRFKTPFDITITAPKGATTVSATHVVREDVDGPLKRVRFARTERLPTYLITFAVGDFDVVDGGTIPPNATRKHPLPLRGIAVKGRGGKLAYAMTTTGELLAILEDYFGTPYPFDKLDIIAAPDFAEGAMENVGAIVFFDKLLFVDPKQSTLEERRAYAETMAHELAHMWFGNIVTMQWWDDTWLNEAFANWMGYRVADVFDPKLDAAIAGLEATLASMHADSLMAARQVHQPVESNHDIANAFDSITYDKGMGVLGMFESYMGRDVFKTAVRNYLEKYRFANATAAEFFATLGASASADVSHALQTFVEQPGVPLIGVRTTCMPQGPAQLTLDQSRYLPLGSEGDAGRQWHVPVCARYSVQGKAHKQCWLLTAASAQVSLDKPGCPDWLMPNADAAGYYRFAIPAEETIKLQAALARKDLSRGEALAFADSLRASVAAGRASPVDVYEALPVLVAQRDARIDAQVMAAITVTRDRYVDASARSAVEAFARELFKGRVTTADFDRRAGETEEARTARSSLVAFLTETGADPAFRKEANRRGLALLAAREAGKSGDDLVDSALAGTVLAVATSDGGRPVQERVITLLGKQEDPRLRSPLIAALGSARDSELVWQALDRALTDTVRAAEFWAVAQPLGTRRESMATTWEWLQTNFDGVRAKVPEEQHSYIPYLALDFCTAERAAEVERFLRPRIENLTGGPRALAAVHEAIGLCAARYEAHHVLIQGYFVERAKTKPKSAARSKDGAGVLGTSR
ncbi:MAG TPA: M1 family metallopeptidase [Myxococcota bacterium]|nr:M1 family metallopeptidase [Myxococcota bacterium]